MAGGGIFKNFEGANPPPLASAAPEKKRPIAGGGIFKNFEGASLELTPPKIKPSNTSNSPPTPNNIAEKNTIYYQGYTLDEEVEDGSSPLAKLRSKVWQMPRNFLELTHEVIGRGKFGSVIRGQVTQQSPGGAPHAAVVQVVPPQILERHEMHAMANDVELLTKTNGSENVIGLIGMCEEKEALFVVLEDSTTSLKQVLLDSRALVHYPAYAEKNQRVSTLSEETLLEHAISVARGMEHLANKRVMKRNSQPKLAIKSVCSPLDLPSQVMLPQHLYRERRGQGERSGHLRLLQTRAGPGPCPLGRP